MAKTTSPVPPSGFRAVKRQDVADAFGVALTTVDNWVRRGAPVVQRGSRGVEWIFSIPDLIAWRVDETKREAAGSGGDAKDLAQRKALAETELVELKLARERGLVVSLEQVERAQSNAFAEVRANLRRLPDRLVSVLVGELDERRIKTALLDEIDAALTSLADTDLAQLSDDDDEGGAGSLLDDVAGADE